MRLPFPFGGSAEIGAPPSAGQWVNDIDTIDTGSAAQSGHWQSIVPFQKLDYRHSVSRKAGRTAAAAASSAGDRA